MHQVDLKTETLDRETELDILVKTKILQSYPLVNRPIFCFAFELKKVCPLILSDESQKVKNLLKEWYDENEEYLKEGYGDDTTYLSFDYCWAEFLYCWEKVIHHQHNSETLTSAILNAQTSYKSVPETRHFDDKKIQILVAVCHELQKMKGKEPFWLSIKDVSKILGKSPTTASHVLQMLVHEDILKVVKKHTPNKATRYHFL